jgi:hypothetical protein
MIAIASAPMDVPMGRKEQVLWYIYAGQGAAAEAAGVPGVAGSDSGL